MEGFHDPRPFIPGFQSARVIDVRGHARADGLSFAGIATSLRRWALDRRDILRVVLGHTGVRYTISVLMADATVERIGAARERIKSTVCARFDGQPLDIYIVGPRHEDAMMFHRPGAYVVFEVDAETGKHAAA